MSACESSVESGAHRSIGGPVADGIGSIGGRWFRTTLSRHTLADGSWHLDWFVQISPDPEQRVATFRVSEPLHRLPAGVAFDAERLPDHRSAYLGYRGEVSRDRGRVDPIRFGGVSPEIATGGWRGRVWWGGSPRAFRLVAMPDGRWRGVFD